MLSAQLLALFDDSATQPIRRLTIVLPCGTYVYLRRSQRLLGGEIWPTLEVANIEVPSHLRGRGRCSAIFRECEIFARHHGHAMFVENVLNPLLVKALRRWGYAERGATIFGAPADWWKKT